MAEPLKHQVGPTLLDRLASNILGVMPTFNADGFKQAFSEHYLELELMPRCHLVADCLYQFLPKDYITAARNYSMRDSSKAISLLRVMDLKSKGVDSNAIPSGDLLKEFLVKIMD